MTEPRAELRTELMTRSAREVLDDHLRLADEGALEDDLARNVAPDITALTGRGVFRGHDGVRELARQLMAEIPSGRWTYLRTQVEGRMAFLEWVVDGGPFRIPDGADSYLIEDGLIKAQTIHYTVTDAEGRVLIRADGSRP